MPPREPWVPLPSSQFQSGKGQWVWPPGSSDAGQRSLDQACPLPESRGAGQGQTKQGSRQTGQAPHVAPFSCPQKPACRQGICVWTVCAWLQTTQNFPCLATIVQRTAHVATFVQPSCRMVAKSTQTGPQRMRQASGFRFSRHCSRDIHPRFCTPFILPRAKKQGTSLFTKNNPPSWLVSL